MKIIDYTQAPPKAFEAENVKGVTGRVAIGVADGAVNICMRIVEPDPGGFSPRHAHGWEH